MAWTIERRKARLAHGSVMIVARMYDESKQLVSKVLNDRAQSYRPERVRVLQDALATAAGVTRRTMFG